MYTYIFVSIPVNLQSLQGFLILEIRSISLSLSFSVPLLASMNITVNRRVPIPNLCLSFIVFDGVWEYFFLHKYVETSAEGSLFPHHLLDLLMIRCINCLWPWKSLTWVGSLLINYKLCFLPLLIIWGLISILYNLQLFWLRICWEFLTMLLHQCHGSLQFCKTWQVLYLLPFFLPRLWCTQILDILQSQFLCFCHFIVLSCPG